MEKGHHTHTHPRVHSCDTKNKEGRKKKEQERSRTRQSTVELQTSGQEEKVQIAQKMQTGHTQRVRKHDVDRHLNS